MNLHRPPEPLAPDALATCESEPLHIPGLVQPEGVLLAASAEDGRITHASASAEALLGAPPEALLGRRLEEVLGPAAARAIADALRSERYAPAQVLRLPGLGPGPGGAQALAHGGDRQLVVEIEPAPPAGENLLPRVQGVLQALRRAATLPDLLDAAAEEMKRLTGYDRVMVYRFDSEGHGEVIAEAREPEEEAFLHLRYPASDIPAQARRMYLLQRVRVIADVDYVPVPVLSAPEEAGRPLDMTFCALRSVSPIHLQYLRNMGVGASLAVSLVQDNALWGMLVCHHRGPRRPSPEMRAFCDLVGQVLSLLIRARSEAELLAERARRSEPLRALAEGLLLADSVSGGLARAAPDLLALLEADGVLLKIGGQATLLGDGPPTAAALAIMAALRAEGGGDEVVATDALGAGRPDLAPLAATASGALLLPLLNNPGDGILWLRREVVQEVRWGGNPDKAVTRDPATGRLTPRGSFAAWSEIKAGQSRPWSPLDLDMARELRRAISGALLRQAEARLAYLAQFDPLTGLANRRAVEAALARPADPAGPSSLLFIDLDRFKSVNDSLGHAAGDELLVQVARRLEARVGSPHLLARLGGDEFVVLCEGTPTERAVALAADLRSTFAEPFPLGGGQFHVTASFGVASSLDLGRSEVLRSADLAMYAAKRAGRDKVVAYEEGLHRRLHRRVELEQELFGALRREELRMVFQPILRVPDKALLSFEALLRWSHPRLGSIAPNEFVPLAEETGLIGPIGAWALQQSLRELRRWRDRGHDLSVSVNASARQIADPGFPGQVAAALAEAGVPPSALILEVTESVLMQEEAVRALGEVRAGGVRIAVDDFGTGYSSLAYLRRLPVDVLKIDRSFLAHVDEDPRLGGFFESIVRMAHTLGLRVVAEGVETDIQWHYLRAFDGDAAQGYWLSYPLERHELHAWIEGRPG